MKKAFKSTLSIVLSLLFLLPLTIGASAKKTEAPLNVWVASDIHYNPQSALGPIEEQNNFPGDPLYAHVNTKGMLTYEADAIIYEFLSRFEKSSAKYLLIAGDLSEEGHWDQHLGIAKILKEFKERTGKKIFVIPGNHDIRTRASGNRLDLSDFLNVYADVGFNETLAHHEGSASYTAELDGGYRLIAIDACIYREDGSNISPDLLAWIEAQVKQAKIDGKKLLGMVHHSVLDHFGIQSISGNLLNISDARNNATKFADWGIKYVLTGHVHANDISMAVSEKGNRIFDIQTDSLITYPNGYRTITLSDSAVKVETDYIKAIDTKYLMKGYNKAQLDLIQTDFPAYSFGCFKAGLNSVIVTMPDLTKKIANSLKIEAGTKGYEALNMAMNTLADGLNLPLYDKKGTPAIDSVEEIAAKAGIKLEPSNYKNVFDIVGALYAFHLKGNENLTYDSPEVTLFRQSFNAALVYALSNIPVSVANTLFKSMGLPDLGLKIKDKMLTKTAKQIYMKTAAKTIFVEFVKPVLGSIITDSYAPGDLYETLEPYGVNQTITGKTAFISDTTYVLNIISRVFSTTLNAVKALATF